MRYFRGAGGGLELTDGPALERGPVKREPLLKLDAVAGALAEDEPEDEVEKYNEEREADEFEFLQSQYEVHGSPAQIKKYEARNDRKMATVALPPGVVQEVAAGVFEREVDFDTVAEDSYKNPQAQKGLLVMTPARGFGHYIPELVGGGGIGKAAGLSRMYVDPDLAVEPEEAEAE